MRDALADPMEDRHCYWASAHHAAPTA